MRALPDSALMGVATQFMYLLAGVGELVWDEKDIHVQKLAIFESSACRLQIGTERKSASKYRALGDVKLKARGRV